MTDVPLPADLLALDPNSQRDQEAALEVAALLYPPQGAQAPDLYATVKEQIRILGSVGPFCFCMAARMDPLDDAALGFIQLCRVLGERAKRELARCN
jgi:hypothetical protein